MNSQRACLLGCGLQIQNKKKTHVEQLTFHKRQNSNDLKSFSIQVASPFCRLWSQPNSIALGPRQDYFQRWHLLVVPHLWNHYHKYCFIAFYFSSPLTSTIFNDAYVVLTSCSRILDAAVYKIMRDLLSDRFMIFNVKNLHAIRMIKDVCKLVYFRLESPISYFSTHSAELQKIFVSFSLRSQPSKNVLWVAGCWLCCRK